VSLSEPDDELMDEGAIGNLFGSQYVQVPAPPFAYTTVNFFPTIIFINREMTMAFDQIFP